MAVFAALGALITSITAAIQGSAVLTAIANIVIGTGIQFAINSLTGRPRNPSPEYQAVINQAAAPRKRGYGWAKLGGIRAFWDSKDGVLYQIIMMHSGGIEAFGQWWVGDQPVTLDADGWVQEEPFAGFIRIRYRRGGPDSAAYGGMLNNWPDEWSEAHQLNGIATAYVEFHSPDEDEFSKVFPESYNTAVRCEAQLSRVLDPKTGDRIWSDNPALCIMDFLSDDDGYPGTTIEDIYQPDFEEFAKVCGDIVKSTEGRIPRYRCWGLYSLQDDPKDTLRRLLATCDGELYERPDGLVGIRGGEWTEPTVTLTDADILSYELEQGSDRFSAFNSLKIIYTEPDLDYQPDEAPRWRNTVDQARRGEIEEELQLDMVPSSAQAQRLAKIWERKQNPNWRGTIRTSFSGIRARSERIIRIVLPELSIDETFWIESHGLLGDLSACEISVRSLDRSAYEWDVDTEEGRPTPRPVISKPNLNLQVPVIEDLATEERQVTPTTTVKVIVATVAEPTRTLSLQAQYQLDPSGPWETMSVNGLRAVSGPAVDSETYNVRARWKTPGGTVSDWSDPESIDI